MFITSVKNNIDRFVAIILVILMALMVINVSWQVASRYIFQNPSAFTDEL
ncbi:MAG TPA: TRAP transporter small permease, partial [Algoriphagus sp.]|nr:TRAP transporter small permease [Algoriphagus sp.]